MGKFGETPSYLEGLCLLMILQITCNLIFEMGILIGVVAGCRYASPPPLNYLP